MRERDFESTIPQRIYDLQSEIQSSMRRLGARAHTGNSGTIYNENDLVTSGPLISSTPLVERENDPKLPTRHTHGPTDLYRDGVAVVQGYTPEELDAMEGDPY